MRGHVHHRADPDKTWAGSAERTSVPFPLTQQRAAGTVARMSALRIEPVIEVLGDDTFNLWPVVGREGSWYQTLHGDLSDAEVGTAVHQILHWFHTDENGYEAPTLAVYLDRALGQHDPEGTLPMAMGGLRFVDTSTGTVILPGCCYSIDERFEILEVLDGSQPGCWLGHSPDGGIALRDGLVEIVQDAEDPAGAVMRFPSVEVRAALDRAEADLDEYCGRVAIWAVTHAPEQARNLSEAITRALVVGSQVSGESSARSESRW